MVRKAKTYAAILFEMLPSMYQPVRCEYQGTDRLLIQYELIWACAQITHQFGGPCFLNMYMYSYYIRFISNDIYIYHYIIMIMFHYIVTYIYI